VEHDGLGLGRAPGVLNEYESACYFNNRLYDVLRTREETPCS
jgi:hypothetical protein